jgi:IS5 family transposase
MWSDAKVYLTSMYDLQKKEKHLREAEERQRGIEATRQQGNGATRQKAQGTRVQGTRHKEQVQGTGFKEQGTS